VIGAAYAAEDAGHGNAGHGGGTGLPDPMHQFEIQRIIPFEIFGYDASFTNSALFMVIAATLVTLFALFAMRKGALVPGRLQSTAELSYEFVANMVRDNAGTAGMKYFPFIFTLFMFVLVLNMLGMIPYAFTVTSHIIVTFALAAFIFIGVTIIGFWKHGVGFLKFFVPSGVPFVMLPLLVVIEVISYLTRPVSLSVRLFANMMAGHTMLKVFGSFVVALGLLGGWAALAFMVAFTGLEILVAFLQAYVFAILTCIYLNDALHMHH
jgi:F-type H+-transporting ATPase subunit a